MKKFKLIKYKIISHNSPKLYSPNGIEEKISHPILGLERDISTFSITTGFLVNGTRLVAEFECDFPLRENPNLDKVLGPILDEAITAGIYPKDVNRSKLTEKIKKSYFAQLALNSVPDTKSEPLMKKLVLWIFSLFAYDNLIDEPLSLLHKDKESLKEFTRDLNDLLNKRSDSRSLIQKWNSKMAGSDIDQKLIKEALLWIDQLRKFKLPNRFIVEATKYFDSSIEEMNDGMNTKTEHYIDARRVSGAVPPVVALAESEMPDTPNYLNTCHAFLELEKEYDDCIWAVNDLGGAKEMTGHEPNFLKTKMREKLRSYLEGGGVQTIEVVQKLFKLSFEELIDYINTRHKKWLNHKAEVIVAITSGKIFENEKSGPLNPHRTSHQRVIRSALEDFKKRCQIRENLFTSGNQCTKVSSRYFDTENPKLNVEISELSFA